MSRTTTFVVVGAAVALVAAGAVAASVAGSAGDGSATGSVPVTGVDELSGRWVAVNDGSAPAPVIGTVALTFQDGRVLVETGCNSARGPVAVEGGLLVSEDLVSTRMACEPALMAQEQWLVQMVSSRPRLEVSGPMLALHWGESERWWLGLEQAGPTPTS